MKFELLPVTDIMLELYKMSLSKERFEAYLKMLRGDTKDDMAIPIGGFNPMAKEHAIQKLTELKKLNAEEIIQNTLSELNNRLYEEINPAIFKVALNLSDDLKGGWTNRYTHDYDSKFKINALVTRNFCVPVFWTSEEFTEELIAERTAQYVYRTVYWLTNPKPKTLKEHIEQEKFVAKNVVRKKPAANIDMQTLNTFYKKHEDTTEYHPIFNFLYGDAASMSLEFSAYGINEEMAGFKFLEA